MQAAKITDIMQKKPFVFGVEIVPPRNGSDFDRFLQKAELLKACDFISVTQGAGGSLRGGSTPISFFCQERHGLVAASHLVCREKTKSEIENCLVELHYFGIRNILALRGDPAGGDKDALWNGDYRYAHEMISHIRNTNSGRYCARPGFDKGEFRKGCRTDFCILVAGHPEAPEKQEIRDMKSKSGADVIITQMIFSGEEYAKYVNMLREAGIHLPVIPGLRPLVSYKDALRCEDFFGIRVSGKIKQLLKNADENCARNRGIRYFSELIADLKEKGAPGVHIFALNDMDLAVRLTGR